MTRVGGFTRLDPNPDRRKLQIGAEQLKIYRLSDSALRHD
jgi:hypothetical protein